MSAIYRLFSFLTLAVIIIGCASCGGDDPVGPTDKTRPTVVSTVPVMDDSLVSLNTAISATFSEPMNPSTMGAGVLSLEPAATGSTSYSGLTVTFTPDSPLLRDTTYTATVATSAGDTAGNRLAVPYVWEFSTFQDTIPPTVISTFPTDHDSTATVNTTVQANFSERMDMSTLGAASFTIEPNVTGLYYADPTYIRFRPSLPLDTFQLYTATITVAATDSAGNHLESDYSWEFYTTPDATPPTAAITAPSADDVVGDTALITVAATDNDRVDYVEFYVDGDLIIGADDNTAPYEYKWFAGGEEVGSEHTLVARAYDDIGNMAISDTVTVHYLWRKVITDGNEGIARNLSEVFVRSTGTQVSFRIKTHNGWGVYNDTLTGIDVVIFIDADQNALTGDRDTDDGNQDINDIGADYQMIIGFHGLYFQAWEGTGWGGFEGVEDLVMADSTDVFEVSITRGRIGSTGALDLVVANLHVMTHEWDWAPDSGHASVSIEQVFTPAAPSRAPSLSAASEARHVRPAPFD